MDGIIRGKIINDLTGDDAEKCSGAKLFVTKDIYCAFEKYLIKALNRLVLIMVLWHNNVYTKYTGEDFA